MHDDSPQSRRGGRPDDSTDSPFDALGLSALFGDPTREIPVVDGPAAQPTYPAASAPEQPPASAPSAPAFSWFDDEPTAPAGNPFISAPPFAPADPAPVQPAAPTPPPAPRNDGVTAFADTISSHPPAHLFPWRPAPQTPPAPQEPAQQLPFVAQQPAAQQAWEQQPVAQESRQQQPAAQQAWEQQSAAQQDWAPQTAVPQRWAEQQSAAQEAVAQEPSLLQSPLQQPQVETRTEAVGPSPSQWTPPAGPAWQQPTAFVPTQPAEQDWERPVGQDIPQPAAHEWVQPTASDWAQPAQDWAQPAAQDWDRPATHEGTQPTAQEWSGSAEQAWAQPAAQDWAPPAAPASAAQWVPPVLREVSHEAGTERASDEHATAQWAQEQPDGRRPLAGSDPTAQPSSGYPAWTQPVADPRVAFTRPPASGVAPEPAQTTPVDAAQDLWRRPADIPPTPPTENRAQTGFDSTALLGIVPSRGSDDAASVFPSSVFGDTGSSDAGSPGAVPPNVVSPNSELPRGVFSDAVRAPAVSQDPTPHSAPPAWTTEPEAGSTASGFVDGPDPLTGGLGALFGGLAQDDDEDPDPDPFHTPAIPATPAAAATPATAAPSQELWMRPRWDQPRTAEEPTSFEVPTDFDATQVRASGSLAGLAHPAWLGEQPDPDPLGGAPAGDDDAWQDDDQADLPAGPPAALPWLSSDTAAVAIASSARPSSFSWFDSDATDDETPQPEAFQPGAPGPEAFEAAAPPEPTSSAPAAFIPLAFEPTSSAPAPFIPSPFDGRSFGEEPFDGRSAEGQFDTERFDQHEFDQQGFGQQEFDRQQSDRQQFEAQPLSAASFADAPLSATPFIEAPFAAETASSPVAAVPAGPEPVQEQGRPFATDRDTDEAPEPTQAAGESNGDAWLKSATALLFGTEAPQQLPSPAAATPAEPMSEPTDLESVDGFADSSYQPASEREATDSASAWPFGVFDDEPQQAAEQTDEVATTAFDRPWDPFGAADSDDAGTTADTVALGAAGAPSTPFGAAGAPTTPFGAAGAATTPFGAADAPTTPFGAAGASTTPFGAGEWSAAGFGAFGGSGASASSQPLRARDLAAHDAQGVSGSDAPFGGASAFGAASAGGTAGGTGNNGYGGSGGSGGSGSGGGRSGGSGSGRDGSGRGGSGRGGSGGSSGGSGSGGGPGQFFNGILTWIRRNPRTSLIAAIVIGVVVLGALSFGIGAATSPASAVGASPFGSASSTPTATATVRPTPTASAAASKIRTCSVNEYASASGFGTLEAQVVNATTGEVLYDRNGSNPAPTASVLKMLTAAAAYSILGPDYRVPTTVVKGSQPGQVVVIGGGDVTLSRLPTGQNSFYTNAPHLDDLANQVKQAWASDPSNDGQKITSLVVDTSLYSGPVWESSWDEREERVVEGSTPYMTSFMVDGDRNNPTAVESPRSTDPVGRAANALADDLGGNVSVSQGAAPAGAKQLGQVLSQPVSVLAEQALTYSDNTIMEELARLVAIKAGTGNSFSAINAGTLKGLQSYGIDETGLYFADGSGLSANNKVPASYLTRFLVKVLNREGPLGTIYDGMPVAGKTGTLGPGYGRFDGSFSSAAVGSVNAKTGWINQARTLAGVIHAKDGTSLTFAIYALNYPGDDAALSAIDNLTTAFYECGNNLSNN